MRTSNLAEFFPPISDLNFRTWWTKSEHKIFVNRKTYTPSPTIKIKFVMKKKTKKISAAGSASEERYLGT